MTTIRLLACLLAWGCAPSDPAGTTPRDPDPETPEVEPTVDAYAACEGGWEPLGALATEVHGILALSTLTARPVVAWITYSDFAPWDLTDPYAPVALPPLTAEEALGPDGNWIDLASDGTRWLAIGRSGPLEAPIHHLVTLTLDGGDVTVTASEVLDFEPYRVAVDGDRIALSETNGIVFYDVEGGVPTAAGRRDFPEPSPYTVAALELDGDTAVVSTDLYSLLLVPADDTVPIATLQTHAFFHRGVRVPEGWLLLETSSWWHACGAGVELLELTGPATGAVTFLDDAMCISAADGPDGPFDAILLGEALVVAHREAGIVRTDWQVERFSMPTAPSLTELDWPDAPRWPSHVEAVGDVAVFAGIDAVSLIRVCPG